MQHLFTVVANLRVFIVSDVARLVGFTLTTISVLLQPPKLSLKRKVSFELQYGTCLSCKKIDN